jgi:hypothetical protein
MADVTMDQMIQKANEMLKLANESSKELDAEKAKANAEKLLAMGRELEKMGADMETQTKARAKVARVEVVLTPDQRKRIFQKHGIQMETLLIDDDAGAMSQTMPSTRLEYIEILAMREAENRKNAAEADRRVRAELDRAMQDIEAQGNAELSAQLDRLKEDPNFAGGLLKKK